MTFVCGGKRGEVEGGGGRILAVEGANIERFSIDTPKVTPLR